ncbi:MAG: hypothetical protein AAGF04_00890 [Chlamydiota bacterium]
MSTSETTPKASRSFIALHSEPSVVHVYSSNDYRGYTLYQIVRDTLSKFLRPAAYIALFSTGLVSRCLLVLTFPLFFYDWIASLFARLIVPAKDLSEEDVANQSNWIRDASERAGQLLSGDSEHLKRIAILVNGRKIDGCEYTPQNTSRYTIFMPGNAMSWQACAQEILGIAELLQTNVVCVGYRGIDRSRYPCTQDHLIASARATLQYVQTKTKEIHFWGFSLGGGIQATLLQDYKPEKPCLVLSNKTFSSLESVVREYISLLPNTAALFLWLFGWTLPTTEFSRKLNPKITHIVVNTGHPKMTILPDRVISDTSALAASLYPETPNNTKILLTRTIHTQSFFPGPNSTTQEIRAIFQKLQSKQSPPSQ